MSAEQTPDIERVLAVLREHSYLHVRRCKCGDQIDDYRTHVAQALAPVLAAAVREAEQRALLEAASKEWQQERRDRADRVAEPQHEEGCRVMGETQTILATPELVEQGVYGNCMQAAIATIVGKPIDAVPHFGAFTWWPGALRLWLRGEGLDYTVVRGDIIPEERAMLCGKSPRGYSHAVVSEGGRIIWDPHPSRDGLTTIGGAYVIHEWDTSVTDPSVDRLMGAEHHEPQHEAATSGKESEASDE